MPTTLILKNIPDAVYERLKTSLVTMDKKLLKAFPGRALPLSAG